MSAQINALLGGQQRPHFWNNLGLWSASDDYDNACSALAHVHAQAIALNPQDHLIDLACGSGASLKLWQQHYGLKHVIGLEKTIATQSATAIIRGRFDQLPLPRALQDRSFDAAICIDAAYHAQSISAFLNTAKTVLVSQGRLVFSTVVGPDNSPAKRLDLRLAGIPHASQVTYQALNQALAADWENIEINVLSSVFSGFAEHVARREAQLTWRDKLSPSWLKILATAALCKRLQAANFDYVLISAQRR
ncbi:MAG: methyltransferase domain-containing protein [Moraxellaceae bacterium]|nr:methyltransferase domain-containing protein [Moraxellaceae bacterium]MDZ4386904.1 methyltransferase domain-containing protein [Moraxellaceae bacterium]